MASETEELALKAFGWSKEQLEKAIAEKKREYGELADSESALKLLADENSSESGKQAGESASLKSFSQASVGRMVSFNARIVRVLPPREFDKNGRRGRVANVSLIDAEKNNANLVLWDDLTDLVSSGSLRKNACVRVENAFVKSISPLEFHARNATLVKQIPDSGQPQTQSLSIREATALPEGSVVDVAARVAGLREPREFVSRDGRLGLRQWLLLADTESVERAEQARVPLIVWNNAVSLSRSLTQGDEARFESVLVKKNASGEVELHANNTSMIYLLKKGDNASASASSVSSASGASGVAAQARKIVLLEEGVESLVEARIARVFDARVSRKCVKCGQREGFCACRETSWRETLFVSVEVEDDSGRRRTVFFAGDAKQLLNSIGLSEVSEVDAEKAKALEGKSFSAVVLPRANRFSGELELVVKKIVSI